MTQQNANTQQSLGILESTFLQLIVSAARSDRSASLDEIWTLAWNQRLDLGRVGEVWLPRPPTRPLFEGIVAVARADRGLSSRQVLMKVVQPYLKYTAGSLFSPSIAVQVLNPSSLSKLSGATPIDAKLLSALIEVSKEEAATLKQQLALDPWGPETVMPVQRMRQIFQRAWARRAGAGAPWPPPLPTREMVAAIVHLVHAGVIGYRLYNEHSYVKVSHWVMWLTPDYVLHRALGEVLGNELRSLYAPKTRAEHHLEPELFRLIWYATRHLGKVLRREPTTDEIWQQAREWRSERWDLAWPPRGLPDRSMFEQVVFFSSAGPPPPLPAQDFMVLMSVLQLGRAEPADIAGVFSYMGLDPNATYSGQEGEETLMDALGKLPEWSRGTLAGSLIGLTVCHLAEGCWEAIGKGLLRAAHAFQDLAYLALGYSPDDPPPAPEYVPDGPKMDPGEQPPMADPVEERPPDDLDPVMADGMTPKLDPTLFWQPVVERPPTRQGIFPLVLCNGADRGHPCRERCMHKGIFECDAYRPAPYPGPRGIGILSACDESGPKEFCTYDYDENGWVCTFGGPIPVCIPPLFTKPPYKPKPNSFQ